MKLSLLSLWLTTISAEVVTLSKGGNITCVVTGETAKSPIYLTPPTDAGFIKESINIDNWITDDWQTTRSVDSDQAVVADKRWEDFKMLNGEEVGHSLKSTTLPFSICASGNILINAYSEDFAEEDLIQFSPNFSSTRQSSCSWFHYALTKQNTTISIISENNIRENYTLGFDPYWIYFKNQSGNSTYWKLHNYTYRESTITTKEQKSTVFVPSTNSTRTCVSMYVSVDKGSFLDINLEIDESVFNTTTVVGFNEKKSLKTWRNIVINVEASGEGSLSFFRGLTRQTDQNGYWAIDEITLCNKDTEVYKVSLPEEAPNHFCEVLEPKEVVPRTNENTIKCETPGFLGTNCNISCSSVLGASYSYCENHKICQDPEMCFCSWGYQEPDCKTLCPSGTWGLFCKNRCKGCQNCHPATGECSVLNSTSKQEEEKVSNATSTEAFAPTEESIDFLQPQVVSSETLLTSTSEQKTQAPENLKVVPASNTTALLTWNYPFVKNGTLDKFVVKVVADNDVNNYTVDVLEPEVSYKCEFPVVYDHEYSISVRGDNGFEGKESRINATFLPTNFEPSPTNMMVETCSAECHLLIPKPKEFQSNYSILGIPSPETFDNIVTTIKNNQTKTKTEWTIFENVDNEDYFIVKTGNVANKAISLHEDKNYSLYLVQSDGYKVHSIKTPNGAENLGTSNPVLTSKAYVSFIIVIIICLITLLLLILLLKLRRERLPKNPIRQDPFSNEEKQLMTEDKNDDHFTKIQPKYLENYLKSVLLDSKHLIHQFRSLPKAARPTVHASEIKNNNKNKDRENVPYDHNRVVLEKMDGMGTDDYINASYIDGLDRPKTYIATQGPKFSTIRDFWRMIWQENVETIIMATNFVENKKRKSAEYFPQSINATFECGDFLINLTAEEVYEHYIARFFDVDYRGQVRNLEHFQLIWNPDDLTPLYANRMVPLVKRVAAIRSKSITPIVIHCSSGVNRTGTLILCDLALLMAKTTDSINFYTLIKQMRDQRPNMISSEKQYILAHLIVLECLMEEENVFKKTVRENLESSILKNQLDFLKRLSWHDDVVHSWTPYYDHLYSNLFHPVDSYATRRKYLITQQPTKNSIYNFWSTIMKERVETVLFLNRNKCQMWPYQSFGNNTVFRVKEMQSWQTSYCTITELVLLVVHIPQNNIILEQIIHLFQANTYERQEHTSNIHIFLNLLDYFNKHYSNMKPILVACHDGVKSSGLFIALDYIIQKCKNEFEADICNAVRSIRRSGIPFIQTSTEMEFLYNAVVEYLQKFDEYSSIL